MPCGNVVRYDKDLYVVADADYDFHNQRYTRMTLIPFDYSNCSTHLSIKHPFTKSECININICENECGREFDSHEDCICCGNTREVADPEFSIDSVVTVADNINDFIMNKFKKMMYED